MVLNTNHLGEIHYTEQDIIIFEDGIPGFEGNKKFIFLPSGDDEFPFHYLQSIEEADLAFIVTDPFLFEPTYDFEISDTDAKKLGVEGLDDLSHVMILSVVNIPENIEATTMNLMAPILINKEVNKGKQIVLAEYDETRFPLFSKKEEV